MSRIVKFSYSSERKQGVSFVFVFLYSIDCMIVVDICPSTPQLWYAPSRCTHAMTPPLSYLHPVFISSSLVVRKQRMNIPMTNGDVSPNLKSSRREEPKETKREEEKEEKAAASEDDASEESDEEWRRHVVRWRLPPTPRCLPSLCHRRCPYCCTAATRLQLHGPLPSCMFSKATSLYISLVYSTLYIRARPPTVNYRLYRETAFVSYQVAMGRQVGPVLLCITANCGNKQPVQCLAFDMSALDDGCTAKPCAVFPSYWPSPWHSREDTWWQPLIVLMLLCNIIIMCAEQYCLLIAGQKFIVYTDLLTDMVAL